MRAHHTPGVRRAHFLLLGAGVAVGACGSTASSASGVTGVTPTIGFAAAAAPVVLQPGESAQATIVVARRGGYHGTVALAATGAPSGVTASFTPAALEGDGTQSVLTVRANADAAPGSYTFTVTGSGAGVNMASITVPVAVTAVAPSAAVVVVAPASLTVTPGSDASATLTLTRTGFTGDLTLTAENLPAGVAATFAPARLSGNASTSALTLAASSGAASGVHAVTVRARGVGMADATAAVALTVEKAPATAALDGIYLGFRESGATGKVYQDYWTFLPNGRVVDSDPYEGLNRPLRLEQLCQSFPCGTYTRSGNELRIRWAEGTVEKVYDLDASGALNERGKTQKYRPLDFLNGLRLDATFAEIDAETDSALVRIELSADGRFREESLMHYTAWAQLGAPGEQRAELAGGTGRYTIERNTLALQYEGGHAAYFTIVVPPGEIGKAVPDAIYINTARIERVR
jgi:hypothetical protein